MFSRKTSHLLQGVQPLSPSAMGWKGHPGHAFGVTEVVGASSPRAFCQAGGFIPPALPETRR